MILYIGTILLSIAGIFIPHAFIGAAVFLIIAVITQAAHGYGHEDDMNHIWEKREYMDIQKRKSVELLDEFKLYLADMYPKIEKEILKSMKPGNVSAYMIKYPELKSSKTICKLVDLINANISKIYDYETGITSYVRCIKNRIYTAQVWVIATSKMKRDSAELLKSYEKSSEAK